jgi:alanyl-tRNA synthetase
MATTRRYYENVELDRCEATILSIETVEGRRAAILDSTIFYPEGGGQSDDRGTINGVAVTEVRERGEEVLHYIEGPGSESLAPGKAELKIDAARRRDFATQHTAQHLLSATILRLMGAPTLSMHLGDEICTIDVDTPTMEPEALAAAEEATFDMIEADYPVIAHLCPPEDIASFPLRKRPPAGEEIIRVIEIDGYDYSPCCGTHLPSTGSIGTIKLIGAEKYKGMTRVSFVAGKRAFRDHRSVRVAAEKAAATFKVPVAEAGKAAIAFAERMALQDRALLNLRETLAGYEAARIAAAGDGQTIVECFGDRGIDEALRVGRALQKLTDAVIVVASGADRKAAALTVRKDSDLRPTMKALLEANRGVGGGGPSYFQAAFDSKVDLDSFLAAARQAFSGGSR